MMGLILFFATSVYSSQIMCEWIRTSGIPCPTAVFVFRLLRASLRNHVVKTADLSVIAEQLASRPKASEMVWRFLQKHWEHLISKYVPLTHRVPSILS